MWSGGEAFRDIWSIYSGVTWAPLGNVQEDGLRVRAVLGHSGYRSGTVAFGDLLIGYHKRFGALTLKVLGGVALADRRPPEDAPSGIGGKGVLEAWWNITDQAWASADVALTSPDMGSPDRVGYGSRIRLGWRLWPELSAGLEGGSGGLLASAPAPDASRIGGFLRYEWARGEVSISGGLAVDETHGGARAEPDAFGTVSVLTRF